MKRPWLDDFATYTVATRLGVSELPTVWKVRGKMVTATKVFGTGIE